MGNAMWSDEEIERHTDSSISKAIKPLENELAFIKQELFEERSLHEATKLCLKAQSDSVLGCAEKVKRLNHQLAQVTQERDALEMSLNKWRAISRDQETELAQAQQATAMPDIKKSGELGIAILKELGEVPCPPHTGGTDNG